MIDPFMQDASERGKEGYFEGKLLVAMPAMADRNFFQSVIYVCGHDDNGAIGLVINKPLASITFPELLQQLGIKPEDPSVDLTVHFGGPVDVSRGFVLHSNDYMHETSIDMESGFALTATLDILKVISKGNGPRQSLLALGYTGWGAGQLDHEIQNNDWLCVDASFGLVFESNLQRIWLDSMASIGINPAVLSIDSGHA